MLSSEFEKEVQHKLEELRFTPPDIVWDNIEASLPRKNRRRLVFYWLLLGLLAGGGILYYSQNGNQQSNKNAPVKVAVKSQEKEAGTTIKQPAGNETSQTTNHDKPAAITPRDAEGNASTASAINKTNTPATHSPAPGISKTIDIRNPGEKGDANKQATQERIANLETDDNTVSAETNNDSSALIKGRAAGLTAKAGDTKFADEKNLQSSNGVGADKETAAVMNEGESANKITDNVLPPAAGEKTLHENVITKEDNAATMPTAADKAASSIIKKNTQPRWQFGLHAGGGVSNVKMGLFEKSMYADPQTNNGSTGGGAFYGTSHDPTPGFAYAAGFYAEKAFSKRWRFYTGLQYQYASNKILVGSKVDSAISLDFSTDKLESSAFYRGGASTSYTNKYHLLQVPVLVNYRPVTGWPLFLEAGGSAAWLAGTNGLQYNAANDAYITSMDAFNRWLVSGNLGAGVRLAQKTNHPVNLGYRFSYTATSITKEAFGKQHLSTSLLYLEICLHK